MVKKPQDKKKQVAMNFSKELKKPALLDKKNAARAKAAGKMC